MDMWLTAIQDVEAHLEDRTKRRMLRDKIDKSEAMKIDLGYFDRMDDEDPEKTHDYLLGLMQRLIQRKKSDKNVKDVHGQMAKHLGLNRAAPGQVQQPGSTKKGKQTRAASEGAQVTAPAQSGDPLNNPQANASGWTPSPPPGLPAEPQRKAGRTPEELQRI